MSKPLCIDLFCGLGGWTEGFLAEGWDVVGFDIEQHVYGEERYPAQLVLQDVRTIHGKQFKDASMIVASSPCQAYSYMAMPWSRAKQIAKALRGQGEFPDGYKGYQTIAELNDLFEQPKRIQREACEAAGRFIPLIQENVKGAQPWVGRAPYSYGSFYLWGDVPALMPITDARKLGGGASWYPPSDPRHQPGLDFTRLAGHKAIKNAGRSWFNIGSPGQREAGRNPVHAHAEESGMKVGDRNAHRASGGTVKSARFTNPTENPTPFTGVKNGNDWFGSGDDCSAQRKAASGSTARKAASARIAKIPFPLAAHIARTYYPRAERAA